MKDIDPRLSAILHNAGRAIKNRHATYGDYEAYKSQIRLLHLSWKDYERAIRQLASILGV